MHRHSNGFSSGKAIIASCDVICGLPSHITRKKDLVNLGRMLGFVMRNSTNEI